MRAQYSEETQHALKFYHYVTERGGRVFVKAIDEPPAEFGSPLKAFEQTLEHEQFVTGLINKLYELALAEKDYATQSLLKWYIDEQVEEEANASYIVETLKLVGDLIATQQLQESSEFARLAQSRLADLDPAHAAEYRSNL